MSRARSQARRLAMQALYQWQVSGMNADDLVKQYTAEPDMKKAEVSYFDELVRQVIRRVSEIDQAIEPILDRKINLVNPVELAILRLGCYELANRSDIPFRVVLNESVELAKKYGSENGHKYVNGILDKLATELRSDEISNKKQVKI